MTEFIATRWYRAPEVLFGSIQYSFKSDMWSLGCLIYEMYASRPLMPGKDSVNQIEKLLEFKGFPSEKEMAALKVDRIEVLLSHFKTAKLPENLYFKPNWNSKVVSLLKCLLEYDPNVRWGTKELQSCELLNQFHKYENFVEAKTPVILKISDNKKCDKDYYRSFIHKVFLSKTLKLMEKGSFSSSLHRSSSSLLKRNASSSMRKKIIKNQSSSLHTKLPTDKNQRSFLHSKVPSDKSIRRPSSRRTSGHRELQENKLEKVSNKSEHCSPYKASKERRLK